MAALDKEPESSGTFVARVAGVFAARVVGFFFAVTASLLMSRWLDRSGQGSYTTLVTIVSLLFTFSQVGLPSAVTFFAGRGRATASLTAASVRLVIALSAIAVAVALLALPAMLSSIARTASSRDALLALLAVPILLAASLGGAILYGKREIRAYTVIQVVQAAISLLGVLVLVGVLGLGVTGGIGAFLLSNGFAAVSTVLIVHRLVRNSTETNAPNTTIRELLGYGIRLYPASITSYLNYRADVLLLNAMRVPDSEIGLYGRAVNFAELLFYVPDSVSAIFYPTVAASTHDEAHRFAPIVSRFTILVAMLGGIALLPVAYVVIEVLLPRFTGSLIPLAILIPGIVSLSLSKVLSSYISGLGHPGAATIAALIAMLVNVLANIWLIPAAGILGAAVASLVSYSIHAAIMVGFAARVSGLPVAAFLVPRRSEIDRLAVLLSRGLRRLRQRRSRMDR